MAFNWPDVSEHDVEILMARDPESQQRIAIFRSLKDGFDDTVEAGLRDAGYTKKDMEGEPVYEAAGGLKGSDVKRLFPGFKLKSVESADDRARISYDGALKEWQEPVEEVALDADASKIDTPTTENQGTPVEQDGTQAKSPAQDGFSRLVREAAGETPEEAAKPELGQATDEPATVVETRHLPDGFANEFRSYLVHEGVPIEAREEFIAAAEDMAKTMGYGGAFGNRERKPQELRHDYIKVATDKELAKSRIIDCMVPFLWSLEDKSDEKRRGYVEFADAHGAEMDVYIDQLREFMDDFVKVDTSKNVTNTFERMLRVSGARPISVLATIEDQKQFVGVTREFAKEDPRLSSLNSTTLANLRMPLTKVRKNEDFRQRLEEMWTEFKADLEPNSPAP